MPTAEKPDTAPNPVSPIGSTPLTPKSAQSSATSIQPPRPLLHTGAPSPASIVRPLEGFDITASLDMGRMSEVVGALVASVKELGLRMVDSETNTLILNERKDDLEAALHRANLRIQELESRGGALVPHTGHQPGFDSSILQRQVLHLEEQLHLVGDRLADTAEKTNVLLLRENDPRMRVDINEVVARQEILAGESSKLRQHLDIMGDSMAVAVDRRIEEGVANGLMGIRGLIDKELRERLDLFSAQHRSVLTEAKADVQVLDQQIKEQLAYNLELSQREIRRDVTELQTRLENTQRFVEDGVEMKRHLADMDGSMEALARRMEQLHNEVLQRHAMQGGMKGRVEMIENMVHEHRTALMAAMDELRDSIDMKSTDADTQRLVQRFDQIAADFKSLRATNTKVETQLNDMKSLYPMVSDMNDRITATLGDSENTAIAVSGELGEVKGKLENVHARQSAVEVKINEVNRNLQHQMEELSNNITNRMETCVNGRCVALEAKVAQKIDAVLIEGKTWRAENKTLMNIFQEKQDDHEHMINKITGQMEGSLNDRLNLMSTEFRELARRVDHAVGERRDATQDMRREMSTVQEIIQGLQQQYDSLLTESAQRGEAWTDVTRDLRLRVESAESTLSQWRTLIDTAMDDLRHQAAAVMEEKTAGLVNQVETLFADKDRTRAQMQRLEDDTRLTAKTVAEYDEALNRELNDIRELHTSVARDNAQMKSRVEGIDSRMQNDSLRLAKAVLDVDTSLNTVIRELKDSNVERDGELAAFKRSLEFLTGTKLPSLEQRVDQASKSANNSLAGDVLDVKERLEKLVAHGSSNVEGVESEIRTLKDRIPTLETRLGDLVKMHNVSLTTELQNLKDQLDSLAPRSSVDELNYEVRTLANAQKDIRGQADRVDSASKQLTHALEEVKARMNDSQAENYAELQIKLQQVADEVRTVRSNGTRTDSHISQVQRSCKEVSESHDRLQQTVSELQAQCVEHSSAFTSIGPKIEGMKKLETTVNILQKTCKDINDTAERLAANINDVQHFATETASTVNGLAGKFDPNFKKLEAQINSVTKNCRDLAATDDKLQTAINDLQTSNMELSSHLQSVGNKVDAVTSKPLATDASLRHVTQQLDSVQNSLQTDLDNLSTTFQEMYDRFATDVAGRTKTLANAVIDAKNKTDSVDATSREQIDALQSAIDTLRCSTEERADSSSKRITEIAKEVSTLKGTNHRIEVGLNDTKSLGRSLGELNERFTGTLNELRSSTNGIAQDLSHTRGRLEKLAHVQNTQDAKLHETCDRLALSIAETKSQINDQLGLSLTNLKTECDNLRHKDAELESRLSSTEKTVKDSLANDLAALRDNTVNQVNQLDDRVLEQNENIRGRLEKLSALIKSYQANLEDHKRQTASITDSTDQQLSDLSGRVDILLNKQGVVDQMNQFGVSRVQNIERNFEEFEAKLKADMNVERDNIDKLVEERLQSYNEKLDLIEKQGGLLSEQKGFGLGVVNDLRVTVEDLKRRTEGDLQNIAALFDLSIEEINAMVETSSEQQKIRFLLSKPVFAELAKGRAGGSSSYRSSSAFDQSTLDRSFERASTASSQSSGNNKPAVGMDIDDMRDGVGLRVLRVKDRGPADMAGIQPNDVILSAGGHPVNSRHDYKLQIRKYKPYDGVIHVVRRPSGENITCELVLGSAGKRTSSSRRSGGDSSFSPSW